MSAAWQLSSFDEIDINRSPRRIGTAPYRIYLQATTRTPNKSACHPVPNPPSTMSAASRDDARPDDIMSQDAVHDPVAVLSSLLGHLRDGKAAAPSSTTAAAALALCEELSNHLRALTISPSAGPLSTACDSQCTTSESDSETSSKSVSKSRPSARSRARLRRQQQQQQQQQPDSLGRFVAQQQQQPPPPRHAHDPAMQQAQHDEWQQWQQWQWQWREHQQLPSQPLPGVLEQQEQHFRSSLWNGQWLVMPVAPPHASMSAPPSHVAMPAVAAGGGGPVGGYAMQAPPHVMIRNGRHEMVIADDATFRQVMWTGGWHVVPRASLVGAHGADIKTRVQRCMKVHRWERMQRVWTEWMRGIEEEAQAAQEAQAALAASAHTTRPPRSAGPLSAQAMARPAWHVP